MHFDGIFETHHARILSCFGPRVGTWLIIQPIFLTFQLSSLIFLTTFYMWLGLPHPSIARVPQCCAHIPHNTSHQPYGDTFYIALMAVNALKPMMKFTTPLPTLHKMLASTWDENNYMCLFQPHSTHLVDKLTLCSPNMAFPKLKFSPPTQHEQIYFMIVHNSKIFHLRCNSSQGKKLSQPTPH